MKLFWILLFLSLGAFAQEETAPAAAETSAVDIVEKDIEAELDTPADSEQATSAVEAPETLPSDLSESSEEAVAPTEETVAEPTAPPAPEIQEPSVQQEIPDESFSPVAEPEPALESEPTQDETLSPSTQVVEAPFKGDASDFEARLNRIYNQFYSESISEDAWKQIAGEKISESYTIQPGDTLWDISVTFFGNGHYWPKVWQLNDDITNPHIISPGYELKFVPGRLNQAPQLNITQGEGTEAPAVETAQTQSSLPAEELAPVIPPPTKKSRSVLQNLPPSLPMLVSKKYEEFDNDGFSRQPPNISRKATNIYLTSYLAEAIPTSLGSVVEGDLGDIETAGLYDQIFVQISGAKPNDRFLVYTVGGQIKASESARTGYPIYCHAEVRIIENVNPEKNVFKAVVVKSVFPLRVGASLMQGSIPSANVEDSGADGVASGEILGGDFEEERFLMGPQQTVYMDRGTEDGVQPGQIFSVRKNDSLRKSSTLVKEMREQIARIKVMKVDSKVATAIVLTGREDVRPGDRFTAVVNGAIPALKDVQTLKEQEDSPVDTGSNSELDPDAEPQPEETDEFIE